MQQLDFDNLVKLLSSELPYLQKLHFEFATVSSEFPVYHSERLANGRIKVSASTLAAAARGILGAAAGIFRKESTPFTSLGIMLDLSRGMVMRPEHLKKWLIQLAVSGCNQVMLYCEDTYKLPGEPMFGYQRGAYSLDEIRDLDRFAGKLGIELVGCIQTLGHLEQVVKWHAYFNIKDTSDSLLPDRDESMPLIEKMLDFWSQALSSRRIHIGMDEAGDLGRGRYQNMFGHTEPAGLMQRHLKRLCTECGKRNLRPMIWSDMFFRLTNPNHSYYDFTSPFPSWLADSLPKEIQTVYWDYYHREKESYRKMIRRHREFKAEPLMASGIWTWARAWYDHEQTQATALPCIEVCLEENVRELCFTMWGDDGAYCHYDSSLAGIFFCADRAWGAANDKLTARRFAAAGNPDWQLTTLLGDMTWNRYDSDPEKNFTVNPLLMLWDDPLLGIYFDTLMRRDPELRNDIPARWKKLLRKAAKSSTPSAQYAFALLDTAIAKHLMRSKLETAYLNKNRNALRQLAGKTIPQLIRKFETFADLMRQNFLSVAKPQGFEHLQSRNAAQIARLTETAVRIKEFLASQISDIAELEEIPNADAPVEELHRHRFIASANWSI